MRPAHPLPEVATPRSGRRYDAIRPYSIAVAARAGAASIASASTTSSTTLRVARVLAGPGRPPPATRGGCSCGRRPGQRRRAGCAPGTGNDKVDDQPNQGGQQRKVNGIDAAPQTCQVGGIPSVPTAQFEHTSRSELPLPEPRDQVLVGPFDEERAWPGAVREALVPVGVAIFQEGVEHEQHVVSGVDGPVLHPPSPGWAIVGTSVPATS